MGHSLGRGFTAIAVKHHCCLVTVPSRSVTGSTGGTLPGMLLAVAMKPGEGEHLHRGLTGRCLLGLTFHQLIATPKQYQQGLPSVARAR